MGSSEGDDDSTSVGAIWHSPDGFSWTRVPHDDDLFGAFEAGSWSSVYEVAYGHSGYVALGSAVLVSSDGLTWSAVEDDSLAPSAGGVSVGMNDVAHGDGVYVIVGAEWLIDETVTDAEDPSRRLLRPAAWWSTDAVHWTQVAGLTDILSGGDGPGPSEVAYSNGRFVVVGFEVLWLDHPYGGPTMVGHVWIGEPEA